MKSKMSIIIISLIILGGMTITPFFLIKNKNNKSTYNPIIKKEYYCPIGYLLNGTTCTKTETIMAQKEYYCITGTLSGSRCITESYFSTHTEYTCPFGYTKSGYNKCQKTGTSYNYSKCGSLSATYSYATNMCYQEINATPKESCYTGYYLRGNRCVREWSTMAQYNYTCPYGYKLNINTCQKEITIKASVR